jgi:hypothetical protein
MLLALIAWSIAVACVAVTAKRFRRLSVMTAHVGPVLRELDVRRRTGRVGAVLERELGEVFDAPSPEHATAAINDRLAEVARDLSVGSELPSAAARIALFAGTGLALIEVARTLPGPIPIQGALLAFAGGVVGAVSCAELGRRSASMSRALRESWDAVAARALEPAPAGPSGARSGDD